MMNDEPDQSFTVEDIRHTYSIPNKITNNKRAYLL